MKKKYEPYIFYTLLTLTVLIVCYIAFRYIKGKVNDNRIEYVYTNEPFDMKELTKNGYVHIEDSLITEKRYTALFLASSIGCSACMGQFQIYNRMITETNMNEIFNRALIVIDTNKNHATWFARVNQLKMNSIADITNKNKTILIKYKNEEHEKQFIIIDNLNQTILFRMKVKAGIQVTYEEINNIMPEILSKINISMK